MNSIEKIRIALVDDHQLFREGLKKIISLENDMEVVAEYADGQEVIDDYSRLQPDIVLMDINMPRVNGVEATKSLNDLYSNVKVIMLSIYNDEAYVLKTLKLGAVGYLLKDIETKTLTEAIRATSEGNTYIHYEVTGAIIREYCRLSKVEDKKESTKVVFKNSVAEKQDIEVTNRIRNLLTSREKEVLQEMAEGNSNRVIGENLFISEKTVKNHVSSILQKLDVQDRTQAVIQAIRNEWINL